MTQQTISAANLLANLQSKAKAAKEGELEGTAAPVTEEGTQTEVPVLGAANSTQLPNQANIYDAQAQYIKGNVSDGRGRRVRKEIKVELKEGERMFVNGSAIDVTYMTPRCKSYTFRNGYLVTSDTEIIKDILANSKSIPELHEASEEEQVRVEFVVEDTSVLDDEIKNLMRSTVAAAGNGDLN